MIDQLFAALTFMTKRVNCILNGNHLLYLKIQSRRKPVIGSPKAWRSNGNFKISSITTVNISNAGLGASNDTIQVAKVSREKLIVLLNFGFRKRIATVCGDGRTVLFMQYRLAVRISTAGVIAKETPIFAYFAEGRGPRLMHVCTDTKVYFSSTGRQWRSEAKADHKSSTLSNPKIAYKNLKSKKIMFSAYWKM